MLDNNFTVKYTTSRNCFLTISEANERKLSYQKLVKVRYGSKEIYGSCVSSSIITDNNIVGIPSLYAKDLCIRENESVYITDVARIPNLTKIVITPISSDDYEVLDLSSETVQNTLLDQIRVVNVNQKLTIWISKWLNTTVKIEDAEPLRFGYLSNLTEVHVMQLSELNSNNEETEIVENHETLEQSIPTCPEIEILQQYIKPISTNIFRVQSLNLPQNLTENDFIATHPFNVFIYENSVPNFIEINNNRDVVLCRFRIIEPPTNIRNGDAKINPTNYDIIVHVCVIEKHYNSFSDDLKSCFGGNSLHKKYPLIYVQEKTMQNLDLVTGSKVTLCQSFDFPPDVRSVEVFTSDTKCKNAAQKFKLFIAQRVKYAKCVINADFCFDIEKVLFSVKFNPRTNFYVFDELALRNCKVYENNETKYILPVKAVPKQEFIDLNKMCCEINELIKIIREAEILLKIKNQNENILITGRSGCGKTTLAKIITENVSKCTPYFYKVLVNCKRLKGKSVESLQKIFTQFFRNLTYYQPSILILNDLDVLCKKSELGSDTRTQESLYSNRVSEMLTELIGYYQKFNRISVIATCQSYFEMNEIIVSPRGQHIFKNLFEMPELSKHNRFLILTKLFNGCKVNIDPLNMEKLAVKTDGFVIQDLLDFVNRCLFEYHKRSNNTSPTIHLNSSDLDNSLTSILPLSLQAIHFHAALTSNSNISLADIGGLAEAKLRLMENVSWPGKYPELFGGVDGLVECPVKYARGSLLFGPPGVGKTALVGAVARECQVRLIVINGPELLSKYVGESERAVRSVFERARRARPCLLFFDEFESAACRRGKDSTGVTDRVVNQLLVQLDGVESGGVDGLDGVYVVAATSRPDLVDPALLRPGRLGVRVLCEVPDQATRLSILKALSKRLNISTDVDLSNIAVKTEGYTGADLQAVLYTAQLLCVEKTILVNQGKPVNSVLVTQEHMNQALSSTQPSLNNREAQKYEKIYAKFQSNKDMEDTTSNIKKQKQILA